MLTKIPLPTLITIIHLTLAIPKPLKSTKSNYSEQWRIPRLDMHMMVEDTGIPGGEWPPGSQFDTTLDFDIIMPSNHTPSTALDRDFIVVTCHASWANNSFPSYQEFTCTPPSSREIVAFQLYPYHEPERPDLSFTLDLNSKIDFDPETSIGSAFYIGNVDITANNPQVPTSYLTCLLGRPYDGLRCSIGSINSVRKDLVVEIEGISMDVPPGVRVE